jgi:hypothetical protein
MNARELGESWAAHRAACSAHDRANIEARRQQRAAWLAAHQPQEPHLSLVGAA